MRVFINEAVCEGCGDCGVKSSCLSVQPVDTELGRKTQIHQSSCNKDYSCLDGDCPAFVEVIPDPNVAKKPTVPFDPISADDLPEPDRIDEGDVLMMGIGGTGVVTVNQLHGNGRAARRQAGRWTRSDRPVPEGRVRHLEPEDPGRMAEDGAETGSAEGLLTNAGIEPTRCRPATADAYLVFDVSHRCEPTMNLEKAEPEPHRRRRLVKSKVPTGAMVRDTSAAFPEWAALQASHRRCHRGRARTSTSTPATVADSTLFRSHMPANVIVLGAAYQQGSHPDLGSDAIERAIELNGVAVETNTSRRFVSAERSHSTQSWLEETLGPGAVPADGEAERTAQTVEEGGEAQRSGIADPSEELTRLLAIPGRRL